MKMNPENTTSPLMSTPNDSRVDVELSPVESMEEIEQLKAVSKNDVEIDMDGLETKGINETDSSDSSGSSSFLASLSKRHARMEQFVSDNSSHITKVLIFMAVVLYIAYFITALVFGATRDCVNTAPLIVLTCVILAYFIFDFIWNKFGDGVKEKCFDPCSEFLHDKERVLKGLFVCLMIGGILCVIIVSAVNQPRNLISVGGFLFFIFVLFLFSEHRKQIKWRPVLCGFMLQFYFAVLILKWELGYNLFRILGEQVQIFLSYADVGSKMIFGDKFMDHFFAMKVLPIIIFFSSFTTVLYHLGVMQAIIGKIALVMRILLGTTAAESLCAAGNIFIGMCESPILIRPFLEIMTKSELHAVMTTGFATIAGGVLAAYISFGVPAEHLLCASVMSAPCALAVSKLLFPETEKSQICNTTHIRNQTSSYRNVLEAAAAGASASIGLVANIAANLIAFLALLAFVNAVLSWFGGFVCFPDLSFEWICSYLFMPVAYLMGVEWKDAGAVGELIGIKTFLNEFVAYEKLAVFIKNRQDCIDGVSLSIKSEVISTYALCGFANLSSIGIMLGGLSPMAPSRASDLASMVIKALFGGIVTCLMTACIAGLLVVHTPEDLIVNCLSEVSNNDSLLILNATEPTTNVLYSVLTNNTLAF